MLLRFWLDLTEVQAAASLGCSIGNVKSQTARALAKLKSQRRTSGLEDQMSIDEGDLRASLSTALDDLDYGPLPLNSVISRERTVVLRRRLTAAPARWPLPSRRVGPVHRAQVGQSAPGRRVDALSGHRPPAWR